MFYSGHCAGDAQPVAVPSQRWLTEDPKGNQFLDTMREEFRALVADPENIDVDFANFPYPVGKGLKDRLLCTAFLHFKRQIYTSFVSELSSMSPRILLTGPYGSNRCQEAIFRALAKEMGSKLLVYDRAMLGLECEAWDENVDDAGRGAAGLAGFQSSLRSGH